MGKECNMQAYNVANQNIATYYKDKNSPLEVELPLEQFLTNKDEVETFKQLTSMRVEN